MNRNELQKYLEENSRVIEIFSQKALAYQQDKNSNRPKKKRWNDVKIGHAVDEMIKTFVESIYDKLKPEIGKNEFDPQKPWIDFINLHEILDTLEESVIEMEFE